MTAKEKFIQYLLSLNDGNSKVILTPVPPIELKKLKDVQIGDFAYGQDSADDIAIFFDGGNGGAYLVDCKILQVDRIDIDDAE